MKANMYEEKFMRFPAGRAKAFTLSYDDGVQADKRLLQIINKYGLKGTFNLNSLTFDCAEWNGKMNEEETYKTFVSCGQEIALHGARHIFLTKVPMPEAINEIVQNRVYLENKFNRIVRGMAYPYNSYNEEILGVLGKLGVVYARTTESTHSFELPEDWLKWRPTCHHGDEKLFALTEEFINAAPEAQKKKRESLLMTVWGHSYEFDNNGNWHILEGLAQKVSGRGDIWFATMGEIYDYVTAYENLVFSMDGETCFNPAYMAVYLEIRGKVYEIGAGQTIIFDK